MNEEELKLVDELVDLFTEDPKATRKRLLQEDFDKYKSKIAPYLHLWRVKDKEWVEHRKEIWQKIIGLEICERGDYFVKTYWDKEERFFLRGKPRKNDKEIYVYRRMAYTPSRNAAMLKSRSNFFWVRWNM